MAINPGPDSIPSDGSPVQRPDEVVFETRVVPSTPLRVHIVVSTDQAGTSTAVVSLGGELCAGTAATLRDELDHLLRHGVAGLTIDLRDLTLCTSHGIDVFAEFHARMQEAGDGTVELRGPVGVVNRVLDIVQEFDPGFDIRVVLAGASGTDPERGQMAISATSRGPLVEGLGHFLADIEAHLSASADRDEASRDSC